MYFSECNTGTTGEAIADNILSQLDSWRDLCGQTYVTRFRKTLHMQFFPKIEFVWLINPTIELTRVQVLDRSHASLWSYRALRLHHTINNCEITV